MKMPEHEKSLAFGKENEMTCKSRVTQVLLMGTFIKLMYLIDHLIMVVMEVLFGTKKRFKNGKYLTVFFVLEITT